MDSIFIYLITILFTSTIAGWLFSRSKKAEKAIKVMTFLLYFWLFAFVQLIAFALLYHYKILG